MTDTCRLCGNPIAPWEPFVRRLAGDNIDVRHANSADCKPTTKPKEDNDGTTD